MRFWITILLAIGIGLLVAVSVFKGQRDQLQKVAQQETVPRVEEPPTVVDKEQLVASLEVAPKVGTSTTEGKRSVQALSPTSVSSPPLESIEGLRVLPAENPQRRILPPDRAQEDFKLKVHLVHPGAGIKTIELMDYFKHVDGAEPYLLLKPLEAWVPGRESPVMLVYPYAARAITINGTRVDLHTQSWSAGPVELSNGIASVVYHVLLVDSEDDPIVQISRRYILESGRNNLTIEQTVANRSGDSIRVRLEQYAQGDVINDGPTYMGDQRKFITGYFPTSDRELDGVFRHRVSTTEAFLYRRDLIGRFKSNDPYRGQIWPSATLNRGARLVWLASENRYFTVVTHPRIVPDLTQTSQVPELENLFPRAFAFVKPDPADPKTKGLKDLHRSVAFGLETDEFELASGEIADLSLGVYAGPMRKEIFDEHPFSILNFDGLIRYSLGGMCTFCTFQWLAKGLLWFLKLIEGQIVQIGGMGIGVHDWGVAIIILVGVVRLILHPITKKAQVNMMKMGRQMSALQPDMEKLKKRYKDDQKKLNQEMMKLYREKGVNPANMLGCLPMFLQMPIWIALYAMLYLAIELRHEPAFYGCFQWISGGRWPFLADLSTADNFIRVFAEPVQISLPFIQPNFQSINLLPILMAVVFYFQQKFTTPPAANEQQAQQQKIMKFMILLFPVFLYSAPSGLTLYILASTAAGIVDSYLVRKHVKEQEQRGELFAPVGSGGKGPRQRKPGGFMDRLAKVMEQKQKQIEQLQGDKRPKSRNRKKGQR